MSGVLMRGVLLRRVVAAAFLVVVGAACRDSALASGRARDADVALCAAAHRVPQVLLAYHDRRISRTTAIRKLGEVRREIEQNATGRYGSHLRDVAAALHVFEVVTEHRGDSGGAYRDLRTLRESLPPCRAKRPSG